MTPLRPIADLPTHEVVNTPPPIGDQDLWAGDVALRRAAVREGAGAAAGPLAELGRRIGREAFFASAEQANRNPPELHAFDRYGRRIDQVAYHPAYHALMTTAVAAGAPNHAWKHGAPGGHVANMAIVYLFSQAESGVLCPMAMTYSVMPVLRRNPGGPNGVAAQWIPRLLSADYDCRDIPADGKSGALVGMFMTEKQGGSDVRANATTAEPLGAQTGEGAAYRLSGHKFFCSAPMCDAFLTLARTAGGLSCFLMPRWTPDGARNRLFIQRLKDKLGNRSNASCEIELQECQAVMVGPEGRGVRTIMDMVTGNRLYCATNSAALMRQALVQALHHAGHRAAFGKTLIRQPLMRNVLADLALEAEAALALALRVARTFDEAGDEAGDGAGDGAAAALCRIGTAIAKYWNCKRAPAHTAEALECLGGPGYIEDSPMPRLYREAPLNSIWEGSGNVICLDVLRALRREPAALPALLAELEPARGGDARLDAALDGLKSALADGESPEFRARRLTERMAVLWQAALLLRHAPTAVAEAFCASRLGGRWTGSFGALPAGTDCAAILERALPGAEIDA